MCCSYHGDHGLIEIPDLIKYYWLMREWVTGVHRVVDLITESPYFLDYSPVVMSPLFRFWFPSETHGDGDTVFSAFLVTYCILVGAYVQQYQYVCSYVLRPKSPNFYHLEDDTDAVQGV